MLGFLLALLLCLPTVAVLPTDELTFHLRDTLLGSTSSSTYYASTAGYGTAPVPALSGAAALLPPATELDLCGPLDGPVDPSFTPPSSAFLMVIPRGNCTFQAKTLRAAQYGAAAAIIYNTEESMYYRNSSLDGPGFPLDKVDYECSNGRSEVPSADLIKPYWSPANDAALDACASSSKCASNRCVLTGPIEGTSSLEACCAWDLHQYLYGSADLDNPDIPAVFVTMKQSDDILSVLQASASPTVTLTADLAVRYKPAYNASSILIWLLGTAVAVLSSFISGADLKYYIGFLVKRGARGLGVQMGSVANRASGDGDDDELASREDFIGAGESMELSSKHAIGFLVMSSGTLLILFFFNLYTFVTVMYAFGCSGAVSQVLLYPALKRVRKVAGGTWWDEIVVTMPCDVGPCR
jgi:hypothetical protein